MFAKKAVRRAWSLAFSPSLVQEKVLRLGPEHAQFINIIAPSKFVSVESPHPHETAFPFLDVVCLIPVIVPDFPQYLQI